MTDAISVSLTRQSGLLQELSVIANNIANASTDGFRREAAVFAEFVRELPEQASASMGSLRGHYTDLSTGTMRKTGGALDLAIEGAGWFGVGRDGDVLLTRAGHFMLDNEGNLVTPMGDPVLDEGGAPVTLPPNTSEISVGPDGTITADGFGVAQIGVLSAEAEDLVRAGDNLWRTTGALRFEDTPRVRQGFLESSNVSPVEEMARLIETQRLYEAGAALQTDEHERIQALIEALGRN
ncbi:flagellar basal-body rod protein FlgF [Parvularcula lutaonensis]|uniref:Flagellar basal-body rod protein FlgF n=1 Tax=Parvularcula lutaonensis TaxID=491923 RepID=A0ABV7M866_9PROT|nr:flagellar basal-body rod protein FlgF [Parvularcula lutaonensis]GGY43935.1 flagellar basal-body rod protein FlgF [Parvularcula lutaonensis]